MENNNSINHKNGNDANRLLNADKLNNMKWVNVKDRKPTEADGQILIAKYGNHYYECAWFSDEENCYKKPFAFDEDDTKIYNQKEITHWMKIESPTV